jgi:hypothetical protein
MWSCRPEADFLRLVFQEESFSKIPSLMECKAARVWEPVGWREQVVGHDCERIANHEAITQLGAVVFAMTLIFWAAEPSAGVK